MPQERQPHSGLPGPGLADETEHLAGRDLERDVLHDGVPGAAHDDVQAFDRDGRFVRHPPLARSMPTAARAIPSPISPVPIVSSARTISHGLGPTVAMATSASMICGNARITSIARMRTSSRMPRA